MQQIGTNDSHSQIQLIVATILDDKWSKLHIFIFIVSLLQVGQAVRSHWYEIGIRLGVDIEELADCQERFPRSLAARLVHIFSLWRKREYKATLAILLEACRQVGVGAAAEKAVKKASNQK